MPETTVDRQDSPTEFCSDFSDELRSRGVSLRGAAERVHWSKSAIGKACTGPSLPSRNLVEDVLTAIGVSAEGVQNWMLRHAALSMGAAYSDDGGEDGSVVATAADSSVSGRYGRRALAVVAVGAALLGAVLAGGIVLLTGGGTRPTGVVPPLTGGTAVVTVQNKVALGAGELVEDTTPAYLSVRAAALCASHGCKVPGSEIASGVLLPAVCVVHGDMMWNYNIDSPAAGNPGRAKSDLWYQVAWPDGRTGYVSEVYLTPESRGGLGLQPCAPAR